MAGENREAPPGGALAARHLAEAVALLMTGRDPDESERAEAECAINVLAADYTAERRRQAERAREWTIPADLARIEAACLALVTAFDGATHTAYDVLHGHGPGGRPAGRIGSDEARRYAGLRALAGRYHLPLAPPDTPAALALLTSRPIGTDLAQLAASLDWPTAAAALGLAVRERREAFENEHRAEVERFNAILDHGPDFVLRSAPRTGARRRSAGRRGRNAPGLSPDGGGQQSIHNSMRGAPGWFLAYECFGYLSSYRPDQSLSGSRDGLFHAFTLHVHALATLQDLDEVETPGDAYDAGLGHHVRVAAKILPAFAAINLRQGDANPYRPLTAEEHAQKVSLELAVLVGRVPAWMP